MKTQKTISQATMKKSHALTYRISLTVRICQEGMAPPVAGNSTTNLEGNKKTLLITNGGMEASNLSMSYPSNCDWKSCACVYAFFSLLLHYL